MRAQTAPKSGPNKHKREEAEVTSPAEAAGTGKKMNDKTSPIAGNLGRRMAEVQMQAEPVSPRLA